MRYVATPISHVTAWFGGEIVTYWLPRDVARRLYVEGKLNKVGETFDNMQVPC